MRTIINVIVGVAAIAVPASQASAERIFGLTQGNQIVTFDSNNLAVTTSSGTISGLASGDTLTGLDLRPATRGLFSVGKSGNVYSIVKNASGRNYTASIVGTTSPAPSGNGFGLDFNPTVDRIRLISDTGQNLRINPDNGVAIVDGAITSSTGAVDIIGAAYARNRPGLVTTTLYAFDAVGDTLLRSTNANAGTYVNTNLAGVTFGPFGFDISTSNNFGFDISGGTRVAYVSNNDQFGTVNLTTGGATLLGTIGAGNLTDITAASVPEPATWAMMIGGFGLAGLSMRRRTTTKTVHA